MTRLKAAIVLALLALPVSAAERTELIERSFPFQTGKIVLVDAGALDLSVRGAAISDIRVRVDLAAGAFKENQAVAWIEAHRPTIEDSERQLHIVAADPKGHPLLKGVVITRARIEIVVPREAIPDLSTSSGSLSLEGEFAKARPLRLRAASGDIEMTGWAPKIEARSTSGDIAVHAFRPVDDLMTRSASGEITVSGGVREIRCDNSTGDVTLTGLLGPAGVATTSGDVVLEFDEVAVGDEVRVTTSSGKVRVSLPADAQPGGELSSTRGDIHSSYGGQPVPESGQFRLLGDRPRLYISTTSGKIELS